jgi:hypothetical protein
VYVGQTGCLSSPFCVVFSCVRRGLFEVLITRPEKSYQVSKIDYENLRCEAATVHSKAVEPVMMMTKMAMMRKSKSAQETDKKWRITN